MVTKTNEDIMFTYRYPKHMNRRLSAEYCAIVLHPHYQSFLYCSESLSLYSI